MYDLKQISNILLLANDSSSYWAETRSTHITSSIEDIYDLSIEDWGWNVIDTYTGEDYHINKRLVLQSISEIKETNPESFEELSAGHLDKKNTDLFLQCVVFGDVIYE